MLRQQIKPPFLSVSARAEHAHPAAQLTRKPLGGGLSNPVLY
jgi:hypothetical protein